MPIDNAAARLYRNARREAVLITAISGGTFMGFPSLYVGGVDPLGWGLLASFGLSIGVSLLTKPDEELTAKYSPSNV